MRVFDNLRGDQPAKLGLDLRAAGERQPAHRLRASLGLWPQRQPRGLAGLRLSDAGGSRLSVADRRAGRAAGAVRTVDRRHDDRHCTAAMALLAGIVAARATRTRARRRRQPVRRRAAESRTTRDVVSQRRRRHQGREPRSSHPSLTPSQLYRTRDGWHLHHVQQGEVLAGARRSCSASRNGRPIPTTRLSRRG